MRAEKWGACSTHSREEKSIPEGRRTLGRLAIAGTIILKLILEKIMGGCILDSSDRTQRSEVGSCERTIMNHQVPKKLSNFLIG
jgi:hypothetical protein